MLPWTKTTVGPLPIRSMSRSLAATAWKLIAEDPLRSPLRVGETRR
jgi:hypothetical protein